MDPSNNEQTPVDAIKTLASDTIAIACTRVFAIKRNAELPNNWYTDNKYLVCDTYTTQSHYYVDTSLITDMTRRMEWNVLYQRNIDFNESAAFIIDAHPPGPDADQLQYIDIAQQIVNAAMTSGFTETYRYFIEFKRENGTVTPFQTDTFLNKKNIFSLPFIIALFRQFSGYPLGVNIDSNGTNLRIGNRYFNISNDPTK